MHLRHFNMIMIQRYQTPKKDGSYVLKMRLMIFNRKKNGFNFVLTFPNFLTLFFRLLGSIYLVYIHL